MTFLTAARDLLQDVITANKPRSGRPPKTSKHTDDVHRRDLRRNLALVHQNSKTILYPRMRKRSPQFALRYLHRSVDDKK